MPSADGSSGLKTLLNVAWFKELAFVLRIFCRSLRFLPMGMACTTL